MAENKNVTYESLIELLKSLKTETFTDKLSTKQININKDIAINSSGIYFNNVSTTKDIEQFNASDLLSRFVEDKQCFHIPSKKNKLMKITKNSVTSSYYLIDSEGYVSIDENWFPEDENTNTDETNKNYIVNFFTLTEDPTLKLEKDKLTINEKILTADKIAKIDDIEYMQEADLKEIFGN